MAKLKDRRIIPGQHYVYAVLCQEGGGPLYVKFGKSSQLRSRLSALRTGTPIPTRYFAFIRVPDKDTQADVEKALHQRFVKRRTQGEWFKFDVDDPEDKQDFKDGCVEVFILYLGVGSKWHKISAKEMFGSDVSHIRPATTSASQAQATEHNWERNFRYRFGTDR